MTDPVKCCDCSEDVSSHQIWCDKEIDKARCPKCFQKTPCGKGKHGEECSTMVFDAPMYDHNADVLRKASLGK